MKYFVIGISGVTCGGKTTVGQLIRRTFPWSKIIHQDAYFYPDDYEGHVRMPDVENHTNFELPTALNMPQMEKDVMSILKSPVNSEKEEKDKNDKIPNFEDELIKNIENIDFGSSKYSHIPILIVEGFTIYAFKYFFDISHARIFLTLEEEECRRRRDTRNFDPPDCPGYFDHAIWPSYVEHFDNFIKNRSEEIKVFDGSSNITYIWEDCVRLITEKLDEAIEKKLVSAN